MGLVKQWLMDEADRERRQEAREWFIAKFGRQPKGNELDAWWDEFENDEAMAHAMDKDD